MVGFGALLMLQLATTQVTWDTTAVLADERAEVLTLARQAGLAQPAVVREVFADRTDTHCPSLVVESAHTRFLHEVSWSQVTLERDAPEEGCGLPASWVRAPRVGRFAARRQAEKQVHWLVEDGGWSVELQPDGAVRFEVVETIVLACHRGTVVDQRGPSTDPRAPAAADMADQITGITAFPSPYTVRLRFGTGGSWIVSVLVDEGQVILFGVSRVTI